jgi:hypothetical protein
MRQRLFITLSSVGAANFKQRIMFLFMGDNTMLQWAWLPVRKEIDFLCLQGSLTYVQAVASSCNPDSMEN